MESSYFYKDCNFEQLLNAFSEKYNEMLPYIEYNYELAIEDTFENNISQFFDKFFELNNI